MRVRQQLEGDLARSLTPALRSTVLMLVFGRSGKHADPVILLESFFQFVRKQLGGGINIQFRHITQCKLGAGSVQVCPCLQAGDNGTGDSEFGADESHMFGKQIHHFKVVLVIRLFGETSSGRVGLDITKENLAGRVACPTGDLPRLDVRESQPCSRYKK